VILRYFSCIMCGWLSRDRPPVVFLQNMRTRRLLFRNPQFLL
jgi:hypothetical protein